MSDLESEYRSLLAWYTRAWRRQNGDAMIATMLDAADAEDRSTSTRAERRDIKARGFIDRVHAYLPVLLLVIAMGVLVAGVIARVQFGVNVNSIVILALVNIPVSGWAIYTGHLAVALICLGFALPLSARRRRVLRLDGQARVVPQRTSAS